MRLSRCQTKELFHLLLFAKEAVVPDHSAEHRTQRQHTKRDQHHIGTFVGMFMGMVIAARRPVERHEHQTPAIETGKQGRDDQ